MISKFSIFLLISFSLYSSEYPNFFYKYVIDNYSQKAPILHIELDKDMYLPVSKNYLKSNPQLSGAFNEFMRGKKTTFHMISDYKSKKKEFNIRKDNYRKYLDPKNNDANLKYKYFVDSLPDDRWIYAADTGDFNIYLDHLYFEKFEKLGYQPKCNYLKDDLPTIADYPYKTEGQGSCVCTIGCALIEVDVDTIDRIIETKLKVSLYSSFEKFLYIVYDFVKISESFAQEHFSFGDTNEDKEEAVNSDKKEIVDNTTKELDTIYSKLAKNVACKERSYVEARDNLQLCETENNCTKSTIRKFSRELRKIKKHRDKALAQYTDFKTKSKEIGVEYRPEDDHDKINSMIASRLDENPENINVLVEVTQEVKKRKRVEVLKLESKPVQMLRVKSPSDLLTKAARKRLAEMADKAAKRGIQSASEALVEQASRAEGERNLELFDEKNGETKRIVNLNNYDKTYNLNDEENYKKSLVQDMLTQSSKSGITMTVEEADALAEDYYNNGVEKVNMLSLTKGKLPKQLDPDKSDELSKEAEWMTNKFFKRKKLKFQRNVLVNSGKSSNSSEIKKLNSEISSLDKDVEDSSNRFYETKQKSDRDSYLSESQFRDEQLQRNINNNYANARDNKPYNPNTKTEYSNRSIKNEITKRKNIVDKKLRELQEARDVIAAKEGNTKNLKKKDYEIAEMQKKVEDLENEIHNYDNPYEVASREVFLDPSSSDKFEHQKGVKFSDKFQVASSGGSIVGTPISYHSSPSVFSPIATSPSRSIASEQDKKGDIRNHKYVHETSEQVYIFEDFFFDKELDVNSKIDYLNSKYDMSQRITIFSNNDDRVVLEMQKGKRIVLDNHKNLQLFKKLSNNDLFKFIIQK